jgi:pimeloyl-ACP methyl ester carboxylesterase
MDVPSPLIFSQAEGVIMSETLLVLLPGMDGTGILFEPLMEALPIGIKPIVVSYPTEIPMSYEQLLPIVIESLPKHAPFILLGESFSGPLAIMAASKKQSNLKALILCATFISNPIPWLPNWSRYVIFTPFFYLSRYFILAKALVAGYGSPSIMTLLRKAHGTVSSRVMAARARAILGVNVGKTLRVIKVPIFFLGGTDDKVSPSKNLREIIRIRPDVQTSLISGPHLILQTKPVDAASLIDSILKCLP